MHLSNFAFSLPILIGIEITVVHLWKISVHVENWFISFSLPTMINLLYDLSLYYCFHPFSIVMYSILLGDFGEENLEVVKSVVNLEFAKAVILGNHDAWFTKQFSGRWSLHVCPGIILCLCVVSYTFLGKAHIVRFFHET